MTETPQAPQERVALTGMRFDELARILGEHGRPSPTRAKALLRWMWRPGALPEALPDTLPGVSRLALERLRTRLSPLKLVETTRQVAADGTIKLLLSADGSPLECVMIPGRGRTTVCVSSQSGCTRDCTFCATALMGFKRNLSAAEIVAQLMLARAVAPTDRPVRNVVFMGMGEPLDNLEQVLDAVDIMSMPGGAGLSPNHITVSTSGVLPRMEDFVARCPAHLALSLNGTTEAQRTRVMPIDRKWPLPTLLEFIAGHPTRLFFIEYILMGGFNAGLEDAQRLAEMMRGLNVRVNLIPFNPHAGASFVRPSAVEVQAFFEHLNGAGIRAMVRRPRGDEIAAACGQLQRLEGERSPLAIRRAELRAGETSSGLLGP